MVEASIALLLIGLIILVVLMQPVLTTRRRERLKSRPFLPQWTAVVERYLPIYEQLAPAERRALQGNIQVFLAEKQFIGCGGLHVTDEMRVAIAAVSSLLLLHQRSDYFPRLRSVLVYPNAYMVNETTSEGLLVEERRVARLGESWLRDQLVLSWAQVQYDAQHWQDGHNVILHEFAHQLDQEDGSAEGVPPLGQPALYTQWRDVMTDEYQHLCDAVQHGRKTVLDSYGATNPAEFFAVATETFFERSRALQKHHPSLYQLLQTYYRLDPLKWL